jgi:hypothetical protein
MRRQRAYVPWASSGSAGASGVAAAVAASLLVASGPAEMRGEGSPCGDVPCGPQLQLLSERGAAPAAGPTPSPSGACRLLLKARLHPCGSSDDVMPTLRPCTAGRSSSMKMPGHSTAALAVQIRLQRRGEELRPAACLLRAGSATCRYEGESSRRLAAFCVRVWQPRPIKRALCRATIAAAAATGRLLRHECRTPRYDSIALRECPRRTPCLLLRRRLCCQVQVQMRGRGGSDVRQARLRAPLGLSGQLSVRLRVPETSRGVGCTAKPVGAILSSTRREPPTSIPAPREQHTGGAGTTGACCAPLPVFICISISIRHYYRNIPLARPVAESTRTSSARG